MDRHLYQEKIVSGSLVFALVAAARRSRAGHCERWFAPVSVIVAILLSLVGPDSLLNRARHRQHTPAC